MYAHVGRKILFQVKWQHALKLPGFFIFLRPKSWDNAWESTDFMPLSQCPAFSGRETWWQRPEWNRVNSGQIPDTDAQRVRFEDVHSTCLLIRSHADLSPRNVRQLRYHLKWLLQAKENTGDSCIQCPTSVGSWLLHQMGVQCGGKP